MAVFTTLSTGQQQARVRWGTQESGAAFDRKKLSYLSEQAQKFIAQQSFCVIGGRDCQDKPSVLLAAGFPGFVETPDENSCILQLHPSLTTSRIVQRLYRDAHHGERTRLGLFLISHPTRERLCVHGEAEILLGISPFEIISSHESASLRIRLKVRQSFFHCSKYIKTRVPGLSAPLGKSPEPLSRLAHPKGFSLPCLIGPVQEYLAQQLLCFLCTGDQEGQPAVNHRGGAPGFLLTLPPWSQAPGGMVLLPDYAGNGAFEAIGNIFETGTAALLVPDYAAQQAVSITGSAFVLESGNLVPALRSKCAGAERIIALSVERVEVHNGHTSVWETALHHELARASTMPVTGDSREVCAL